MSTPHLGLKPSHFRPPWQCPEALLVFGFGGRAETGGGELDASGKTDQNILELECPVKKSITYRPGHHK